MKSILRSTGFLCGLLLLSAHAMADTALAEHDYDYGSGNQPTPYEQRYGVAPLAPAAQAAADKANNKAELDFSTIYDNDPSSDVNGGSSYGLDTTLYSATIDDKWRLFAGEYFSHELEPFEEGHINYSRSMAGLEYYHNYVRASLAPTFNVYNGNERTGAVGAANWDIDNNWIIGGGAQLFSRDIPLRALNAGVTANSYNANTDWYQDKIRNVRVDFDAMTFSDDNVRTMLSGADTEHLYASSHFTFDGLVNLVESQNSENENRAYFNPGQDVLGMVGGRLGQPLYNHYSIAWDHSLEVKPGVYWQRNYGSSPAVTATYAHHVNYQEDVDGSLGLSFTRQDADGAPENDVALMLNVTTKF